MENNLKCPHCGNSHYIYNPAANIYKCLDCDTTFNEAYGITYIDGQQTTKDFTGLEFTEQGVSGQLTIDNKEGLNWAKNDYWDKTITLTCDRIILQEKSVGIAVALEQLKIEKVEEIEINGIKFKREE